MSILIGDDTRLLVQGITGSQGSFHAIQMFDYGTNVVAGCTPGKGGAEVMSIPVYDTVYEAVEKTGANASVIFVPPPAAADSILEAADAGIGLIVCITEGIPVLDMIRVKNYIADKSVKLIGPNCPGIITPGICKVGILPGHIHKKGHVGIISRSGTLTYEAVNQLSAAGIGQSTAIGIGGDSVRGLSFTDCLDMFESDPDTYAVVMIGEIGGTSEEEAAVFIKKRMSKPVAAFISGQNAPPGKRMGHAGAIVSKGRGNASGKLASLRESGVRIADTPDRIGETLVEALKETGIYEKCLLNWGNRG